MKRDARFCLPFVLTMLLAGCGGGSSSGAPATNDVQGLWLGTYGRTSSSPDVPLYAIITADGSSYLFDPEGFVYVLPVSPTLDGTMTADAPPLGSFEVSGKFVSQTTASLSSSGSATVLTGNFSFTDGTTDQFSLSPYKPFSGKPSVITTGTWSGVSLGVGPSGIGSSFPIISVVSDGTISGSNGVCSVSGNIKQVTPGENLFTVRFQYDSGGTNTNPCNAGFDGFAFESSKDITGQFKNAKGTYYYMVVSNSNAAVAFEFMVP